MQLHHSHLSNMISANTTALDWQSSIQGLPTLYQACPVIDKPIARLGYHWDGSLLCKRTFYLFCTVRAENEDGNPLTCQPLNTSGVTGRETSPENGHHHNAVAQQHSGAAAKGKVTPQELFTQAHGLPVSTAAQFLGIYDVLLRVTQGSHQSPGANEGASEAGSHSRESDLSKALRSTQNGHAAQQPR